MTEPLPDLLIAPVVQAALAEDLGEEFLRSGPDEPVAFFGDANGDGFVFVWVEAADDRRGRG